MSPYCFCLILYLFMLGHEARCIQLFLDHSQKEEIFEDKECRLFSITVKMLPSICRLHQKDGCHKSILIHTKFILFKNYFLNKQKNEHSSSKLKSKSVVPHCCSHRRQIQSPFIRLLRYSLTKKIDILRMLISIVSVSLAAASHHGSRIIAIFINIQS